MSYRKHPEPAPNYTDAFLATLGLILFMAFWVIAALAGYLWVAIVATGLDRSFRLLARRGS